MITYTSLGKMGRLGNQMFQIASTIGIAIENGHSVGFNQWPYEKYFANNFPVQLMKGASVREHNYHHDKYSFPANSNFDLVGYFQSWRYFDRGMIREQFKFKRDFADKCFLRLPNNGKKNIAIHIRRGDYVGNPSHFNLSMRYYIQALHYMPNWLDHNVIIFSDDMRFAKWHFSCLPNVYFMEKGTDIEDLCTMSQCHHFIVANSSFSYWAAYLGERRDSIVVRPQEQFSGPQLRHDIKDLYPEHWVVRSDYMKVDLGDTTFVIPAHCDHNDRLANLNLVCYHLQDTFNTEIHIGEQGGQKFNYTLSFARYFYFPEMANFHRTAIINSLVKMATTPFVVNYDADVLVNPVQIWYSVILLRKGADIVYPYDGNFKHIPRRDLMQVNHNMYWLINRKLEGPTESYGGAVFMHRRTFLNAGGENENFIAFGPEDAERFNRFCKLGLVVQRVPGPIYHLDHFRGINSSKSNPYIHANRAEWHKVKMMSKQELMDYVKTWRWAQL